MKASDIITRVRNIAGDVAVLQFTDAMLLDWINDGVRSCAINNHLLQKRATGTTINGISEYDLPLDILKLHSVTVDGSKLQGQTLQENEEVSTGNDSGTPVAFYLWAGKINLFPTPVTGSSLVINYTYDPPAVTDSTKDNELVLPVGYHSRIVDYCLAQVAQQDGDSNLYTIKMQEFDTGVQSLKDQSEYQNDLYPYISVSGRDSGDYFGWE